MRQYFLILAILSSSLLLEAQESQLDSGLIITIKKLKMIDQQARGMIRKYYNGEIDTNRVPLHDLEAKMQEVDSLNFLQLQDLVEQFGFPGYHRAGQEGSDNFWLLIQHQDKHPEFQLKVLDLMKKEVARKNASSWNYAYLVDRIKINKGHPQIYGTQMTLNKEKTSYEPKAVIDPLQLNERRKTVGLGTIEEYIKTMNSRYYGTLKGK